MKIAVIGSGGREHAILWRLSRDRDRHMLWALPGNGGTGALAKSVQVSTENVPSLVGAVSELRPDLVVVGPEVPLAAGLADRLRAGGIPCFGPVAGAARIEASKVFAKQLMHGRGIPTADFEVFEDFAALEQFVRREPEEAGWVVKADGLAAGKGAYVCSSLDEVLGTARSLLVDHSLGAAGERVVLERKLVGREVSALYWCDGEHYRPLPPAQDYKRALDGDRGPNTGGMGSYCPAGHLTPELAAQVGESIVQPTLDALREESHLYRGVLYVGLMLTASGPQVIEYNCRFGDPETQVILPIWEGEFAEALLACAEGRLARLPAARGSGQRAAVCVVLAADGYPDSYAKGIALRDVPDTDSAFTLHAGTTLRDGELISSGGRVLNAVGLGASLQQARERAYELAAALRVEGLRYRTDIAERI